MAIPHAEAAAIKEVDARAARVRTRLAAILMDVASRDRRAPCAREERARPRTRLLEDALARTAHDVDPASSRKRLSCRRCLSEVGGTRGERARWLLTACVPPQAGPFLGAPGDLRMEGASLTVCGRQPHPSDADVHVWSTVPLLSKDIDRNCSPTARMYHIATAKRDTNKRHEKRFKEIDFRGGVVIFL